MKSSIYILFFFIFLAQIVRAEVSVKIIKSTGDAKVRFGLDEEWQKSAVGINLKEIDTILTGENGEIVLQFESGKKFMLGNNSILDIGDLREIQEQELFLFLMAKKVDKIEPRQEKTKLRIGDISSLHGSKKASDDTSQATLIDNLDADKEINGSIALYMQNYYTNTLYKLYNLLDKYKSKLNLGKVNFYIAKAFEALDKKGQALDAYQRVIQNYENIDSLTQVEKKYLIESKTMIEILKQ